MQYQYIDIHFCKLSHFPQNPDNLKYGSEGAACFDICTGIDKPITLKSLERFGFSTGLKLAPPSPIWFRICGRSGLAVKHGISPIAGIIDTDYRGEIIVCLVNTGKDDYTINPSDKIAQVEIPFPYRANFIEISEEEFAKNETQRGSNGFGSTGF